MDTDGQSANQDNNAQDTSQDWLFDAFCQPRTIPDNWDLTEMTGVSKTNGDHRPAAAPARRQPDPADQAEDAASGDNLHIYYPNPFPEPRTYPVYWDLI